MTGRETGTSKNQCTWGKTKTFKMDRVLARVTPRPMLNSESRLSSLYNLLNILDRHVIYSRNSSVLYPNNTSYGLLAGSRKRPRRRSAFSPAFPRYVSISLLFDAYETGYLAPRATPAMRVSWFYQDCILRHHNLRNTYYSLQHYKYWVVYFALLLLL